MERPIPPPVRAPGTACSAPPCRLPRQPCPVPSPALRCLVLVVVAHDLAQAVRVHPHLALQGAVGEEVVHEAEVERHELQDGRASCRALGDTKPPATRRRQRMGAQGTEGPLPERPKPKNRPHAQLRADPLPKHPFTLFTRPALARKLTVERLSDTHRSDPHLRAPASRAGNFVWCPGLLGYCFGVAWCRPGRLGRRCPLLNACPDRKTPKGRRPRKK